MDAGILNRRVTIDQRVTVQDSSGDPVADWQELATVWAKVAPLTGFETDFDSDVLAGVETRIHLRYSPITAALKAVDRIRYGERIYNIIGPPIDVNSAHVEMLVKVGAGLNDG